MLNLQNVIATIAHSRGLEFVFQLAANNYVIRCADGLDLGRAILATIHRVTMTSPRWGHIWLGGVGFSAQRVQAAAQVPWDSGIFDLEAECDLLERFQRAGWKRHRVKLCPKKNGQTQFLTQSHIVDLEALDTVDDGAAVTERAGAADEVGMGADERAWKQRQRVLYHHINATRAWPKSKWLHASEATKDSQGSERTASKVYEFSKWFDAETYPVNPVRAPPTLRPSSFPPDLLNRDHWRDTMLFLSLSLSLSFSLSSPALLSRSLTYILGCPSAVCLLACVHAHAAYRLESLHPSEGRMQPPVAVLSGVPR